MEKVTIEVNRLRCKRCSNEWLSLMQERLPKQCPSCRSSYWNRDYKTPGPGRPVRKREKPTSTPDGK